MALLRQSHVGGFISKDIETYGVVKITPKGKNFITQPVSFMVAEDHQYHSVAKDKAVINNKTAVLYKDLLQQLTQLRKSTADGLGVPPYTVFQEASLNEMALKLPLTIEELIAINGIGEGKAHKYGKPFLSIIQAYIEEKGIERPEDMIVKSTGANSGLKLYMIQSIDRKLPLDDIAAAKGMSMNAFLSEMETIVFAGTKLDISYWIDELLDEEIQEELHEYFMEAESDDIALAIEEFEGDLEEEEIRLYRIKFISEVAN